MPEFPRELPHLYLPGRGRSETYTTKARGPRTEPPPRNREAHAQQLQAALARALSDAERLIASRPAEDAAGTPGFYLEFHLAPGAGDAAEKLEDRRKKIELVAVRHDSEQNRTLATVFVPHTAAEYFVKKVEAYRTEQTRKGKPKNEPLVARVDAVSLAAVRSVYTDEIVDLPAVDQKIWWEVWIRHGRMPAFEHVAGRLDIPLSSSHLVFAEREVRLAWADVRALARVLSNSDAIAELRRAKDTPDLFVRMSNAEQRAWTEDLVGTQMQTRLSGFGEHTLERCPEVARQPTGFGGVVLAGTANAEWQER